MARVITVSAAECTLTSDVPTIEPTSGLANITVTAKQADGSPFAGMLVSGNIAVSSTGTGNTITAVDTVTNQQGRARFTFSSTVAQAKTISATVRGTAVTQTAAVSVAAIGDLTPEFFSDWATQTPGTTADIKGDFVGAARKWDAFVGGGGEVVAATGLDFPAGITNVYYAEDGGGFDFVRVGSLSVPATNVIRYYRWYFRFVGTYMVAWDSHPIQDGNAAPDTNWQANYLASTTDAGKFQFRVKLGSNAAYPNHVFFGPLNGLDRDHTYRYELSIERTAPTTFECHVRVYNESGVLVLDDSDMVRQDSGGAITLADNPQVLIYDWNNTDGLNAGCNGSGQSYGAYAYQGGFAVCDNQGWIGPYGSVDGEA